ncbi:PDR/VanB family oxidoreductase [Kibdelosporangium philippinense]|uniref:PDR/VanB family oxidoreductase n=1 Tax=Kibdelosporangium philippinense TaxID=211113 RepID=A0ABS8ZUA7_9PSEU|nr:PDR/VanB family oxidoreductase [Kibdelosporangium philippinense]MCE7011325.1 PDR/VanB family oxidoreductase [Kibdelosporangium philippinense]
MSAPPDLYGRRPTDRLWKFATRAISAYEVMTRFMRSETPEQPAKGLSMKLVVRKVKTEAEDVVSLTMSTEDWSPLPTWQPGCHIDLRLPSGTERQYSLCGDPEDRWTYRIAVRKLGAGSQEVHAIKEGDLVTVRGPRNAFPFIDVPRYLFIAGGIGITPILPMVKAAQDKDWHLVYCGRSRDSMPFLDEIAELDPARVWIRPDTEFGVPVSGKELLTWALPNTHVYCCGPAPMIAGVRVDRTTGLHYERFSPPPIVDGRPFEIELRRTGTVLQIPKDRTALDVIREAMPAVAYSCRQGFCGTCTTKRVDGGDMRICVDRGRGRIVLDM